MFAKPCFKNDSIVGVRLTDRVENLADFLGIEKVKYEIIEQRS